MRSLPMDIRRRGNLHHIKQLPFHGRCTNLLRDMLYSLAHLILLIMQYHATLTILQSLGQWMQHKYFIFTFQFHNLAICAQILNLIRPTIHNFIARTILNYVIESIVVVVLHDLAL